MPDLVVAPSSVSRASLTDSLAAASRSILRPEAGTFDKFNSLQVCAEEFGTFLTQYETEFMSTLNHLYDCVPYKESKRSMKEPIVLKEPHLNIIAATTPAWLSTTLPDSAWSEGFASRLTLVFSAEKIKIDPWSVEANRDVLEAELISDLHNIHSLYGQFQFDEDVASTFRLWYMADCTPAPEHPKLEHYLPRRHVHFLKLCMVFSAARSSDLVIRMQDYQEAMNLMLETESFMPDVFKSMKYNSDSNVMDEVYSWVWQTYAKTGKGLPEHLITRFIAERAPSYAVDKIFRVMIASQFLVESEISSNGGRPVWKPAPKQ